MGSIEQGLLQRHRLTVAEYHRLGEVGVIAPDARVELIEGEIVDMPPIGSRHAAIVSRLARLFERTFGDSAFVTVQNPVQLSDRCEPQPDVMLASPRADDYGSQHPTPRDVLLLVEVCDTSAHYDRAIKVPLYARHGVRELWLVDLERRDIRVHREPRGEHYLEVSSTVSMATVEALPDLQLDLSRLFD